MRAQLLREALAERTVFLAPVEKALGLWEIMNKLEKVCSEELLIFLTESRRGLAIATGIGPPNLARMSEEATHMRNQGDIEGALRAVLGQEAVPSLWRVGNTWNPTRGEDHDPEGRPTRSAGPQEATLGERGGSRVGRSVAQAAGGSSLAACLRTPTPDPDMAVMD